MGSATYTGTGTWRRAHRWVWGPPRRRSCRWCSLCPARKSFFPRDLEKGRKWSLKSCLSPSTMSVGAPDHRLGAPFPTAATGLGISAPGHRGDALPTGCQKPTAGSTSFRDPQWGLSEPHRLGETSPSALRPRLETALKCRCYSEAALHAYCPLGQTLLPYVLDVALIHSLTNPHPQALNPR